MKKNKNKDARNIGVALILGLIIGLILYFMGKSELTLYVKPIGVVFIRLLKMVIIPLVFSSIYMSMV
ncbi:MAG: glutamate:protein symporter, partial [Epsilonproteobacteria bacterium]